MAANIGLIISLKPIGNIINNELITALYSLAFIGQQD